MYTEKQMLAGECTHSEYWKQFVTRSMIEYCIDNFRDKVLECENDSFNNIPLAEKDRAAALTSCTFPLNTWQELNDKKGWRPSQSQYVCCVCAAMALAREFLQKPETPNSFTHIVNIGRGLDGSIFCRIKVRTKEKGVFLSIVGVEGPQRNGNCKGGCGQIADTLEEYNDTQKITYAEGWDEASTLMFVHIWKQYHLNDLTAKEIPADSLKWLFMRPETTVSPAWV
ncbi:hypothetical protein [uncultured Desulfovibrio sp.]|uniref:hypothetical protein n=1 Tax=uncultured Desulfovibrio sp. TaxID=167968 RepID=UPI002619AD1C|nr:hypothetical protein [uncultured Desulfovibrio sp.]